MNKNTECNWQNPWTDSGDRGAAQCDHEREYHPDHTHVWGDSSYDWEGVGTTVYVTDPDDWPRAIPVKRTEPQQRCVECSVRPEDNKEGRCPRPE